MGILTRIARPEGLQFSANPDVFRVDASPGAGMACFAAKDISKSEMILAVQQPVACVVVKKFRKEVCAWCYSYAFGSIHKIKLEVAKGRGVAWFCKLSCRDAWMVNVGETGWEAISAFEEGLSRNGAQSAVCVDTPCDLEQIQSLWEVALQEGGRILAQRLAKPRLVPQTALLPAEVDIDEARFILSSCITFSRSQYSINDVLNLVPTLTPYTSSTNKLRLHIKIYHYILSVLPVTSPVLLFVSPINIMSVVTRDAGNSWGVWDKSLAGEELFAYCMYPPASLFNHSCHPNILKERTGRIYQFRASGDLALGTELNVSYLGKAESELSWQGRQEILLVSFNGQVFS
jgi:SET domain